MTETIFLSLKEIIQLTGRQQKPAQRRMLQRTGIEHIVRADGGIIVSRSHVEKLLDGRTSSEKKKNFEPNWSALNA